MSIRKYGSSESDRRRERGVPSVLRGRALVAAVAGDVPTTPEQLHDWIRRRLGITIAAESLLPGHSSPMDYLVHTFFEGTFTHAGGIDWHNSGHESSPDCVVWANRGGGKTFLGAIASLLDMLFKPTIQVRILAGSLDQGRRMHEHLRRLLRTPDLASVVRQFTARRVMLANGSVTEILAASETSIRGTRPQKVRCDEVDLFHPDLWNAVLLTTRSLNCHGPWGSVIRGGVDALSTMQRPHGLMWTLVSSSSARGGRAIHRWGVIDTLERCPPSNRCQRCTLFPECAGKAKLIRGIGGHITIDDACKLKSRVDRATWESEMLCIRPRATSAVYPEFDPATHVAPDRPEPDRGIIAHLAGMDFGIRSETVVLLASLDDCGGLIIEREHLASGLTVADHIAVIRGWIDAGFTEACPAVDGAKQGIGWIGIDPAGCARNEQTGISNRRALRDAGFLTRERRTTVESGIHLVRRMLAPADGATPRLAVRARCTRLIEALQRYHYPENRPEVTEPVKDGLDHACDALRYLVVNLDHGAGFAAASYLA